MSVLLHMDKVYPLCCNSPQVSKLSIKLQYLIESERPFSCSDCGKAFRSKNTLTNHMRIHTGVKPYMCATCGKRFATNKVRAHMRSHGARSLACPQCARMFTHARALELHARTHAPPTRPHRCELCPRAYNHKQSLNKHVRKRHASPQKLTTSE